MRRVFLSLALLVVAAPLVAQRVKIVPPVTPHWLAESVQSWNLAVSEVVEHGSDQTVAFPTGIPEWPYLVLWRSTRPPGEGDSLRIGNNSSVTAVDANFNLAQFSEMSAAYAAFTAIDPAAKPRLVTMQDNEFLVFSVKPCGTPPDGRTCTP
ncbi:MAG TPA: hypothetical protein VMS98_04100 [Thermoanaerobaculia bacterium]|nr:hypothetical protein [Thermoanaerobaculia bacterium]